MITESGVNGPGNRLVIWTQGCGKGCVGCFNPETWKFEGGELWHPVRLANYVLDLNPEGLTLTGGDPLEQADSLLWFLSELHHGDPDLKNILPRGILLFSGYTLDEIIELPKAQKCLSYIDLLIDGRFVESLRYTDGLAGSSNQQFHFSNSPGRGRARIEEYEVQTDQSIEISTRSDGLLEVTGFPAINRRLLSKLGLKILG